MKETLVSLLQGTLAVSATPLDTDLVQRLDGLYAYHHRQWWCRRQQFARFKRCSTLFNALALVITAAGLIIGPVLKNSVLVASLAAVGLMVKGWIDVKKFGYKVDMCGFAYTTYEKLLTELRAYVRGLPLDEFDTFLVRQQTLEDVITDFTPPIPDAIVAKYNQGFRYVKMQDYKMEQREEVDGLSRWFDEERPEERPEEHGENRDVNTAPRAS